MDEMKPAGYMTPHEAAGEDATFVSRIREDITVENGLSFWCVADNLRKGAALNAVQIAEVLINRKLIKPRQQAPDTLHPMRRHSGPPPRWRAFRCREIMLPRCNTCRDKAPIRRSA